jgi:predicted flap endonuclease-1-like 5' DNA nuclease
MTAPSEAPIVEPSAPPIEPEPRPEPVVAAPPSSAEPTPVYDEDAAMRAIEGGWSRVGARAMSEAPELSDLGAAVAAATTAVEQVLAKAGIDIDTATSEERPKGLGRPRNGVKDDLKRIVGLGALDESTLNNLGVYHYEQIARWNAAQVAWMENHVFARGRIAREDWQSQARALIPPPSF